MQSYALSSTHKDEQSVVLLPVIYCPEWEIESNTPCACERVKENAEGKRNSFCLGVISLSLLGVVALSFSLCLKKREEERVRTCAGMWEGLAGRGMPISQKIRADFRAINYPSR